MRTKRAVPGPTNELVRPEDLVGIGSPARLPRDNQVIDAVCLENAGRFVGTFSKIVDAITHGAVCVYPVDLHGVVVGRCEQIPRLVCVVAKHACPDDAVSSHSGPWSLEVSVPVSLYVYPLGGSVTLPPESA